MTPDLPCATEGKILVEDIVKLGSRTEDVDAAEAERVWRGSKFQIWFPLFTYVKSTGKKLKGATTFHALGFFICLTISCGCVYSL